LFPATILQVPNLGKGDQPRDFLAVGLRQPARFSANAAAAIVPAAPLSVSVQTSQRPPIGEPFTHVVSASCSLSMTPVGTYFVCRSRRQAALTGYVPYLLGGPFPRMNDAAQLGLNLWVANIRKGSPPSEAD
jgi:hypothetical protein